MWFSKKAGAKDAAAVQAGAGLLLAGSEQPKGQITTKRLGDAAESAALAYLVKQGLKPLESNYRTPGRGGGEIDLIMRARDGTLVFVEVRQRSAQTHGGAGASIGSVKQRRIVFAARHYLMT
jgi:putative endonuclease